MSLIRIYILAIGLTFLIPDAYGATNEDSLYKVIKIKRNGDHYIVNAKRNDSLFKIISKKVSPDITPDLEKLRKGKHYYFEFYIDSNDKVKSAPPLTGIASYLHVKRRGFLRSRKWRTRRPERFHYRTYETRNLIGLYYSRWVDSGIDY